MILKKLLEEKNSSVGYGFHSWDGFTKLTGTVATRGIFGNKREKKFELHCPRCGRSELTHTNWCDEDLPIRSRCVKGHEFQDEDAIVRYI